MRLVVDLTRCDGVGQCAFLAPAVFRMRDGGAWGDPEPDDAQREQVCAGQRRGYGAGRRGAAAGRRTCREQLAGFHGRGFPPEQPDRDLWVRVVLAQGSVPERRFVAAYGYRGRVTDVSFGHGIWLDFYQKMIGQPGRSRLPFPPPTRRPTGSPCLYTMAPTAVRSIARVG
jgi:ferredoxin